MCLEAILEEDVIDEVEVNCEEKLNEDWQEWQQEGASRNEINIFFIGEK